MKTAVTVLVVLLIGTLIYLYAKPSAPSTTEADTRLSDAILKLQHDNDNLQGQVDRLMMILRRPPHNYSETYLIQLRDGITNNRIGTRN